MQIMFMSMGEPLLNQKELIAAIKRLHILYPQAALLISTSAPRVDYAPIRDVSVEVPTAGLQFSVHESTDEARAKLIPFAKKLTLREMAEEGLAWGYFNAVLAVDELDDHAKAMAQRLAAGPSFANGITKNQLNMEWDMSLDTAIEAEAQAQALCMQTKDFERAYHAFVAKQRPLFEGD